MRKLVYGINISVDGCCDHTKFGGGGEIHEYFANLMRDAGLLVYGRKTYELMVPYWPEVARNQSGASEAENDFARVFDSIDRVVFSKTLDNVEDKQTRIVHKDLRDEILKLKQEPGKNIIAGGVDLPSQLMEMGLIDEYHLVVHPIIVGEGRRLFNEANLPERLQLKLVDSQDIGSGILALHYMKDIETINANY